MDGLVAAKNFMNNVDYVDIGKFKAVMKRIDAAIEQLKSEATVWTST